MRPFYSIERERAELSPSDGGGGIEEVLVFPRCVWFGLKKWRDEKLFCLVKKNERIKNVVCLNFSHM